MKQSGTTTVFVIICIAVLLGAWGTGLCIRQVRFRSAGIESKPSIEPQMSAEIRAGEPESEREEMAQFRPERGPMPGGEGRRQSGDLSEEERERMRERFENMSEEERQEYRAQMRERFGGRRPQGGDRFGDLSEEERARSRAERESMRERLENMSEEERQEFMAQRRERFGGRRPQGDGEGGRRRPGARRRENDLE